MKKLSKNQWIAVSATVIVIIIFYTTGQTFVSFFAQETNTSNPLPIDTATTEVATSTNEQTQNMNISQSQTVGTTSIEIKDTVIGKGALAVKGKLLTVNYTGSLPNGKVFDTSIGRAPFEFTVGAGQVIQGWDVGFEGMKVGGKRHLIIPPAMAYGAQGIPGAIPGNATLIFDVELLAVK